MVFTDGRGQCCVFCGRVLKEGVGWTVLSWAGLVVGVVCGGRGSTRPGGGGPRTHRPAGRRDGGGGRSARGEWDSPTPAGLGRAVRGFESTSGLGGSGVVLIPALTSFLPAAAAAAANSICAQTWPTPPQWSCRPAPHLFPQDPVFMPWHPSAQLPLGPFLPSRSSSLPSVLPPQVPPWVPSSSARLESGPSPRPQEAGRRPRSGRLGLGLTNCRAGPRSRSCLLLAISGDPQGPAPPCTGGFGPPRLGLCGDGWGEERGGRPQACRRVWERDLRESPQGTPLCPFPEFLHLCSPGAPSLHPTLPLPSPSQLPSSRLVLAGRGPLAQDTPLLSSAT